MRRVRSMVHLVAQREALERLEFQDSSYRAMHQGWITQLHPAEAEALKAYDEIVDMYVRDAPPAGPPQVKAETLH